jgi:ribosomal protein S18 acetylase RimI-like enzyme
MDVVIRRLEPGDEDVLASLTEAHEGPTSSSDDAGLLSDERAHLFVAFLDRRPAGFVLCYLLPRLDGGEMVYLYEIAVAGSLRGRGIGRVLMREAKRLARSRGARRLFLHTEPNNEPAARLYAASGGTNLGQRTMWNWSGEGT